MARIRTIKPEFWTDSFMVQLPYLARLIYIALWTAADDHGFLPDEPERIAMEVMPKEDPATFDDWMQFFEASGRIELMVDADGASYYRIPRWASHQRVDKPSRTRIGREGAQKIAIPNEVRRRVATKYGCAPGEVKDAACYYCGSPGAIHWHTLSSGRPSAWVTFPGLELDHHESEQDGGQGVAENIVLACRNCNRSKGPHHWLTHLFKVAGVNPLGIFRSLREDSWEERKGKEEDQGMEGKGTHSSKPNGSDAPPLVLDNPKTDGKVERLRQVTIDAIETFNAAKFTKAQGGTVPNVSTVGLDTRMKQVARVVKTAREICQANGGGKIDAEFWADYWAAVNDDPFKSGRQRPGNGHENWTPSFEYLTRPKAMLEVFEKGGA